MNVRKAIIVAAGRGRRLGDETDELPKCMVEVGGRPILHWQLAALQTAGIDDVVVVRGYLGERIHSPGMRLRFIENPDWQTNNILASLMYAAAEMDGGFFFSYSDIVFAPSVVNRLARPDQDEGGAAGALIVDRRWEDAYEGRTEHPVSEAELTLVRAGSVARVGKRLVERRDAAGEFIGLGRLSAVGADALRAVWTDAVRDVGLERPFGNATSLRQTYLTDGLNALIAAAHRLVPVFIDGEWREIDTQQDLASAERSVARWSR